MHKTTSGRWVPDKPAPSAPVERDPTETELWQAEVRRLNGWPDSPFGVLSDPQFSMIAMPDTWPVWHFWASVGRETLREAEFMSKGSSGGSGAHEGKGSSDGKGKGGYPGKHEAPAGKGDGGKK